MRAWRIYPPAATWALAPGFDPLDGAGGRVAAGRWNNPGLPVIYAATNPSLAGLETIANLHHPGLFQERTLLEIEFADDTENVSPEQVIRLREDAPPDDPELYTREYGSSWLKEKRSLALLTPSFVLSYDLNVLLNPLHPHTKTRKLLRQDRIRLDSRLLGRDLRISGGATQPKNRGTHPLKKVRP